MKKSKKLISLLLALTMLLGIIPMAMAANAAFTLGQTSCHDAVLTKGNAPAGAQQNQNLSEGRISKDIGETGLYKRLPRYTTASADYLPVEYIVTDDAVTVSNPDVIGELVFSLQPGVVSGWSGTYPCIEFDYKALKAGSTKVSLKFYYKFDSRSGLNGWYYDLVTFTVNVSTTEVQKPNKPTVTDVERFRNYVNSTSSSKGAVYMWCDTYDHQAWFDYITEVDDTYTLGDVVANDGTVLSKGTYPWVCKMTIDANKYLDAYNAELGNEYGTHYLADGEPETQTVTWYYNSAKSVWEYIKSEAPVYIDITHTAPAPEVKEYTVIYTDGVDGAVFADQTYTAKAGDPTPAFGKDPYRKGYTFAGWQPEVAKTVNENATYTAKWDKVESVDKPTRKPYLNDRCYVRVQCVNTDAGHTLQHLDLLPSEGAGRYTEDTDEDGNVFIEKDGVWTYTITLNRAKFIESFCTSTYVNKTPHTDQNPDQMTKMSWTWNAKQKLWKLNPVSKNLSTVGALIEVKCDLHSVAEHTVTFDSYGGSKVEPQEVEYGLYAQKPADPTLKGFTFAYWYLDDENKAYDFENTPVTADITLTAKWEINKFKVTFDTDGGSKVDPQEVEYGLYAQEPEDPTLKGFTFAYWYLDNENEAYDFENTPVTADITLTAKWEINKYTVTYDFRKVVKTSDVKNLNNPTIFTIEDLPLTLKAPTFKNNEWPQKFLNWRDADGNVVTEITEPGDITLYAYYQFPVRYRVYDEDGKEVKSLTVIDWYNEDDFASYKVRPATVDMPGYELDGWYQTLKDAGNVNKRFGSLYMAKKYELVGKLNCCINVTVEVNGETVNEQKFTGAKGGTPDYRSLYSDIVISAVADGSLVEYATYIDGERSTGTLPVFGTNANVKIVIITAALG